MKDTMATKLCTKCGTTKGNAEFPLDHEGRPQGWCRACRSAYAKARRAGIAQPASREGAVPRHRRSPRRVIRSPEALGLGMASRHGAERRAEIKLARLHTLPLKAFEWKELRNEFNIYVRLFPNDTGRLCRCGHPKKVGRVYVHVTDALPGERACQPEGVLCPCKRWSPLKTDATQVAKAARSVRSVAGSAWRGRTLPRSWKSLEKKMVLVYHFVQKRKQ
jgi:hypothetical protein